MRILVYRWRAYNYADICEAFTALGYEYITIEQDLDNYDEEPEFEAYLAKILRYGLYRQLFCACDNRLCET